MFMEYGHIFLISNRKTMEKTTHNYSIITIQKNV